VWIAIISTVLLIIAVAPAQKARAETELGVRTWMSVTWLTLAMWLSPATTLNQDSGIFLVSALRNFIYLYKLTSIINLTSKMVHDQYSLFSS